MRNYSIMVGLIAIGAGNFCFIKFDVEVFINYHEITIKKGE